MLEIIGALAGFASSAVPNLFKIWQDKMDKEHEVTLLGMQLSAQAQASIAQAQEIQSQALAMAAMSSDKADVAEVTALATTWQSGIKWVDGFNASVRPMLAYAFFLLYATLKVIHLCTTGGIATDYWTETDNVIFLTIISYFFGQRAMMKVCK